MVVGITLYLVDNIWVLLIQAGDASHEDYGKLRRVHLTGEANMTKNNRRVEQFTGFYGCVGMGVRAREEKTLSSLRAMLRWCLAR